MHVQQSTRFKFTKLVHVVVVLVSVFSKVLQLNISSPDKVGGPSVQSFKGLI